MAGQRHHTLFKPHFVEMAYRMCLVGYTNDELASIIGVSPATIEYWIKHKPEFKEAVYRGRAPADGKVAEALFLRAVGWKDLPPEVRACEIWLRNRQRTKWVLSDNKEPTEIKVVIDDVRLRDQNSK